LLVDSRFLVGVFHWLEWQNWSAPVLRQPYAIKNGHLEIPDAPGIGLEWDESFIAAHLADL